MPQPFTRRGRSFWASGFALLAIFVGGSPDRTCGADEPAAVAAGSFEVGEDLTAAVSIEVAEALRRNSDGTYVVSVTVTNTSDDVLSAPLSLVIDSTGIPSLKSANRDAALGTGESVLSLLDKGSIEEGSAVSVKLEFKVERRLNLAELRKFDLQCRVVRPANGGSASPSDGDDPRQRPLAGAGNWPFATREPISFVTGRPASEGAWPQGHGDEAAGDQEDGATSGTEKAAQPPKVRLPYEPGPGVTPEAVNQAIGVQNQYTAQLLGIEGVAGTATGVDRNGNLVIRVYAERHGVAGSLPKAIEGIPVEMKVKGRMRTLDTPQDKEGRAGTPGPGFQQPRPASPIVDDTQQRFERPIPIGVSGINVGNGCGTGTIGSRVVAEDGTLYALSNWHVFTADSNAASGIGEPIQQPGPLDTQPRCTLYDGNTIGTLAAFIPIDISFFGANAVDAALAEVTAANVGNWTPKGGYGIPRSETAEAFLGMKVLKVGRTTGYTSGIVTALNAAGPVGGYLQTFAYFENQIEIVHPTGVLNPVTGEIDISFEIFGDSGDSGSLIVSASGRQPVALLFAGNGFSTLGNPIDVVLAQLGAQVGKELRIDGTR